MYIIISLTLSALLEWYVRQSASRKETHIHLKDAIYEKHLKYISVR